MQVRDIRQEKLEQVGEGGWTGTRSLRAFYGSLRSWHFTPQAMVGRTMLAFEPYTDFSVAYTEKLLSL